MKKFFADDLDGKWTIGVDYGLERGTESIITLEGSDDWIYPEDFQKQIGVSLPYVLNVYNGDDKTPPDIDVYSLPDNWEALVTKNNGLDHLPSIHDVMKLI